MAEILPDHEIKKLIGSVLIGADEKRINPNGIELRLGEYVHFESTGEDKKLKSGNFLQVSPTENVLISSLEKLDFTREIVQNIYPNKMLMALITPTTTMMREGISQVSTKVDAGFRGVLNWGFRNSSTKKFTLQYGEPLFKLTIFLLEANESPKIPYGQGENHTYQDTAGIKLSQRKISANIPKKDIIASNFGKLDPHKQLREAGYPFNHIGTELVTLQGKFEVVSSDIRLLKDQFQKQTDELSAKIGEETNAISKRLEDFSETFFLKVEGLFQQKFGRVVGVLIAAISIMWGIYKFLQAMQVQTNMLIGIGIVAGIVVLVITYLVTGRSK